MLPLLIVDGYNVLFAQNGYAQPQASLPNSLNSRNPQDPYHVKGDPFVQERDQLLSHVALYAQGKWEAVVVFDAAQNKSTIRENPNVVGVQVVYSRPNFSADAEIEELSAQAIKAGRSVRVITNDATVRACVGGLGAEVMSSVHMLDEIAMLNSEVADELANTHTRMTLADRLDSKTRQKLDALIGRL